MNRIAWHFINADWRTSSGGLLVEIGKPLIHVGALIPYESGLHASTRAIDALSYSRGPVITLVECEGEFVDNDDKFVCRKRTALWGYDATDELWAFARLCALEVLPFWPDAPDVVREFLETGNEGLRAAARAATRDAARDAARAAAWAATWAATRDAARAAAWEAAWDAARDAAWDAAKAGSAARAAAGSAAKAWAAHLERCNHILESLFIDGAGARGLLRAFSSG